ncbi:prion-inhibition and propagation-domain-containing protein [Xylogone sp. PMI_703]|nr:prion-inhibition and propagation-domain-containing protein [Xylogone sp. PMI_703]
MDPITAAGIALSITSLALQVFAGCVRGYQIFVESADMPQNFEHLRTRLKIEQARLLNWGENIGLVEELLEHPSQTLRLNQNLILDILLQVQTAFKACIKIESKFGEITGQTKTTSTASSSSKPKQRRSFLHRTLAVLENPARISASLQWAMVKSDEFEGLVARLIGYNDAVWSLLDRHHMQDLRVMQQQSNLIMLQLAEQVSELRQITAAMAIRPAGMEAPFKHSFSRTSTIVEEEDQTQDLTLSALATFKEQHLSIEASNLSFSEGLISLSELPSSLDKSDSSALFEFGSSMAWLEWREPVEDDLTEDLLIKMDQRVWKLAKLLSQPTKPKQFRAPRCLGYVCDMEEEYEPRYGFVYEVPAQEKLDGSSKQQQQMHNLREMFLTMLCPSLTRRMRLALMISESLFYLHAVNWLHKGLRSKSILFFTDATPNPQTDFSSPIVSGFDFSRPDLPDEVSVRHPSNIFDDLYRPPERLEDPYGAGTPRAQKSNDVYSLGIILLEIAFWQPIEMVMGISMEGKNVRSLVRKIRERILDRRDDGVAGKQSILAELEGRAGDVYAEVVRRCVQGGEAIGVMTTNADVDADDPEMEMKTKSEVKMQQVFFEEILAKLQVLVT